MRISSAVFLSAWIVSCGDPDGDLAREEGDTLSQPGDSARADIVDADGVGIGAVFVTREGGGVKLDGALIGLPPGEHGFHIHHTGSCEPPIFESAGKHVAPAGNPHGFDVAGGPHAGDLRNLSVAADSTATVAQTNERVTLRGGDVELLDDDGSAFVVHTGPDDYSTQPSGDSGVPIACGVIEEG